MRLFHSPHKPLRIQMPLKSYFKALLTILKSITRHCQKLNLSIECACPQKKFNIAATIIVKNEKKYMREWIEYHRLIGIEHFFIYDNESNDGLRDFLDPYINQGIASYAYVKGTKMQMPCYEDSTKRNRKRVKWMAFLDADEFINIHTQQMLSEFLALYENFSGIGINWISFDSNNHNSTPNKGFVISNYTQCYLNPKDYGPNRHIKSIVKTLHIRCFHSPHIPEIRFSFRKNHYLVTESFKKISGPLTENSTKKIQINHYFSKSKEEYQKKIARGRADNGSTRNANKSDYSFDEGTLTHCPPPPLLSILQEKIEDTYS